MCLRLQLWSRQPLVLHQASHCSDRVLAQLGLASIRILVVSTERVSVWHHSSRRKASAVRWFAIFFKKNILEDTVCCTSSTHQATRPTITLLITLLSAAMCIVAKWCKIGLWCVEKSDRNVGSTFQLVPLSALYANNDSPNAPTNKSIIWHWNYYQTVTDGAKHTNVSRGWAFDWHNTLLTRGACTQ